MLRYTVPLFVAGMGSALELCPLPYRVVVQRQFVGLSDAQRLASDWYRVGYALYSSIDAISAERAVETEKDNAAVG